MINYNSFDDKPNFEDVYIRNMLLGLCNFFRGKLNYYNNFEDEAVLVNIPLFYSLAGKVNFVMDNFMDDIPDKRVEMNTDIIPRGVLTANSWNVKREEFSNPNIYINRTVETIDGVLTEVSSPIKWLPMKFDISLDVAVKNEIDVNKIWSVLMEQLFSYKYYSFIYKSLKIDAVFQHNVDISNPIVRDETIGSVQARILPFTLSINTFFPIVDTLASIANNNRVNWKLQIWNPKGNITTDKRRNNIL